MNKKIISGILLLIFSTGTINLNASLTEKFAAIKQKVKNSIQKVTLKDALTYTALVGVGIAVIVQSRRLNKHKVAIDYLHTEINKQLTVVWQTFNTYNNTIESLKKDSRSIQDCINKTTELIKEARIFGLYPHTDVEEKDGQRITRTVIPVYEQLKQMWQQINQINDLKNQIQQLRVPRQENLQSEQNKSQEEPPKQTPEGLKNRRRKK
jgi:hypothetical protein